MSPRIRALELRASGLGYQAIADACGVVVSTAWKWTMGSGIVTADAHDRRRKPMSAEHKRKIAASVIRMKRLRRMRSPAEIERIRVALGNFCAGLGIAGALCAAFEAGRAEQRVPAGWYPGCCIEAGLYDTEIPWEVAS